MTKPKLRGLAVRLEYARVVLHSKVDGIDNAYGVSFAASQAEAIGRKECLEDVAVPALFADVPILQEAWERGRANRIDTPETWRNKCVELQGKAMDSCGGGGYEWFLKIFSANVDEALSRFVPYALHEQMLVVAHEFDYISPDERKALDESLEHDGFCVHGIERDCCPAGCGEFE